MNETLLTVVVQLLQWAITGTVGFVLWLLFRKPARELIRRLFHLFYKIEIDEVFYSRSAADDDLLKDLDKTRSLSIWTSRGTDLSSNNNFQRILERAKLGRFKIRIMLPHPAPSNDEYNWTKQRNDECRNFDLGMADGVLSDQIRASLSYLRRPIDDGLVEVRLSNSLQLGRMILTEYNAYFAPYSSGFHGNVSRVWKCPARKGVHDFLHRIYESLWNAATPFDANHVTTSHSLLRIANVECLIFDLDGTILDSMPAHQRAIERVFAEAGLALVVADFTQFGGRRMSEIISALVSQSGPSPSVEQLDHLVALEESFFIAEIPKTQLIAPVIELLQSSRQGLKIGLVSGSSKQVVNAVLEHFKLTDAFDVIVTADNAFPSKPAPDGLLAAASKMGVASAQCVVLEDSPAGFAAAKAANMRCLDVNSLRGLLRNDIERIE